MSSLHWMAALFGSVVLELLKWYQLREKLNQAKYAAMLKSIGYWVATACGVIVGVGFAFFWANSKATIPKPYEVLFAAAAAPTLIKAVLATFTAREKVSLGAEDENGKISIIDYFFPSTS